MLVFEDALLGVEAASRAGMRCIAIPDKRSDKKLFYEENAVRVLDSLEQFDFAEWSFKI